MQKIFSIPSLDKNLQDDFIVSENNIEAYQLIKNFPQIWGVNPYPNAILLKGAKSSGKTYLATIWAQNNSVSFIDLLTPPDIAELKSFNCFVIDNLGKNCQEENLLHYFNILNEMQKYLLIIAHSFIKFTLKDLDSRIKALKRVEIFSPNQETMKFLIQKTLYYYSVDVKNEVIEYMSKVFPRDYKSIVKYTKNVNELALVKSKKITIPLVKQFLDINRSSVQTIS